MEGRRRAVAQSLNGVRVAILATDGFEFATAQPRAA
jgi:hypothetical protein